jgi:two-component system, response regulator, stage 0 sporulation protein F
MSYQARRHPALVVIDDERDILTILHRVLRGVSRDYDIIATSDSAEVLAQVELRPVPLVITDYHMAGMNGLQLAAAIKDRVPATCVVLITAFASGELQNRARLHVDYYLPKPFALATLEQIVRATLAGYHPTTEGAELRAQAASERS